MVQEAAQATANAAEEEMGDVEDGAATVVALESRLTPGSFAAVWRPAQSEADAGRLEIVCVRELLVRGPKAGYRVQEEMDIASKDGGWLKGDLLQYESATGHLGVAARPEARRPGPGRRHPPPGASEPSHDAPERGRRDIDHT